MNSNNKLEKSDVKNHAFCYFDDIINIIDLDLDNILLNEKSYENILIYDVVYKTPYGTKPLRVIFDKVYGYIRKYDGT